MTLLSRTYLNESGIVRRNNNFIESIYQILCRNQAYLTPTVIIILFLLLQACFLKYSFKNEDTYTFLFSYYFLRKPCLFFRKKNALIFFSKIMQFHQFSDVSALVDKPNIRSFIITL